MSKSAASASKGGSKQPRLTKKDEAELANQKYIAWITNIHSTIKYGVKWGCIVAIACFAYLSIQSLSGKSTSFDSIIKWGVDLRASEAFLALAAFLCGGGWYRTSKALKKTRKDFGTRLAAMEKMKDPARSSSGLQDDGLSPEEDPT